MQWSPPKWYAHVLRSFDECILLFISQLSPCKRQRDEKDANPNNESSDLVRGASSGAAPTEPASNFSVTAQLALLDSTDAKVRSHTLEELLKAANKGNFNGLFPCRL